MLKIQEVVNFVNSKLNELGTESDYSFDIHAEIGENQNNGKINGILYTNQASTTPIPDYTENNYSFVCELLVPSARANYHFEQIEGIVENFIKEIDGTKIEFAEGEGLLNITPSKPENFNIGYNAGENVPLFFTINVLYTEGAVTSGDVHWLLNGMEIPFLNDDIIVDKEGNVNKIYGKYNTQVFLTSQTRYYRFRFPFKRKTTGDFYGLCESLQNDLLTGNFDKQYTLTFYDGTAYTEDAPFETTVSIFKSGNASGQRGKVKIFDITFAEVDDTQETDNVRYYLALIDNKFDNQTEDTRWFEDVTEFNEEENICLVTKTAQQVQQEWYEAQIQNGAKYERIKAPNLNSIDITSQIYPNTTSYDMFDLANKNYAIIKVEKGSGLTLEKRYFYYFVTNCQIGADNQILYDLKLDTIQTYIFDKSLKFGDCYIERANINRWGIGSVGQVPYCYFDFDVDSLLFEKEKFDKIPQRLTNRQELNITEIGTVPSDIVAWLNEYVSAWVYIYADPNHDFALKTADGSSVNMKILDYKIDQKGTTHQKLSSHLSCLVYPIFRKEGSIRVKRQQQYNNKDTYIYINEAGYNNFWAKNDGDRDIVAIKISLVPPFYRAGNQQPIPGYSISGSSLTINADAGQYDYYGIDAFKGFAVTSSDAVEPLGTNIRTFDGLYSTINQLADFKYDVKSSKKYGFRIDQVAVTIPKKVEYNPKLLSQTFSSIKLVNQDAEGFEYDYSKIGQQDFAVIYSEPLSPDISRSYIRLDKKYGLYEQGTTENFLGTVATNDNSLIRTTTAYQNMLSQQKNFFQQNAINRDVNLVTSVIGGLSGIASGIVGGNALSVAGGMFATARGIGQEILSRQNEAFTIDNLKNAPSSIQNAKGNVFLNAMTTELGVYMEEYDILPSEKESVNDYMIQYGFSVNKIGNIFEYLGNSLSEDDEGTPFFRNNRNKRHYFNFIQAKVNAISGISISNVARADMRQRFENGVRFWKQDDVDYTYENYEEWLTSYIQ